MHTKIDSQDWKIDIDENGYHLFIRIIVGLTHSYKINL